jgi:hypothetical protein
MPAADDKIRDILAKHGEQFQDSVWRVQGTAVIYHKALERIATKADIVFERPQIIRAERDEAVIMVVGKMGDNEDYREEWSIGECVVNVNYRVTGKQAAYPYAMAEKRAKDRVILKLIELSGLVYSEQEADEFKEAVEQNSHDLYLQRCRDTIKDASDPVVLRKWWTDEKQNRRDFDLTQDEVDSLKTAFGDRLQQLAPRAVG